MNANDATGVRLTIGIILSLTLATSMTSAQVSKQPTSAAPPAQKQPPRQPLHRPVQAKVKVRDRQYNTVVLSKVPDLAGLPSYPEKKMRLLTCLTYPQLKQGFCCNMEFNSKETTDEVLDFYRSELSQNGWKINDKQSSKFMLTANLKQQGLTVMVMAGKVSIPEYKSRVTLRYLQFKPQSK